MRNSYPDYGQHLLVSSQIKKGFFRRKFVLLFACLAFPCYRVDYLAVAGFLADSRPVFLRFLPAGGQWLSRTYWAPGAGAGLLMNPILWVEWLLVISPTQRKTSTLKLLQLLKHPASRTNDRVSACQEWFGHYYCFKTDIRTLHYIPLALFL